MVSKLNYFPNDLTKHIDYVICYREVSKSNKGNKIKEKRELFIKRLEEYEKFSTMIITDDPDNPETFYLLLNCSMERLMEEAERMHLELPLKNFELIKKYENYGCCDCCSRIKSKFENITQRNNNDLNLSAPFQNDIRFVFEGFDVEVENCVGFSNTIRSLLVDNILKNMNNGDDGDMIKDDIRDGIEMLLSGVEYDSLNSAVQHISMNHRQNVDNRQINDDDKDITKVYGIQYMLNKNYFDDAFILHDESIDNNHYDEMVAFMMNDKKCNRDDQVEILEDIKGKKSLENDLRSLLDDRWAKAKNIFKYQPLWLVREYFGEVIGFYFAWVGTLLTSLWFPVLVGLGFFIYNIINTATTTSSTTVSNFTSITQYGDYYINIFAGSFDNVLTLPYAGILCLWGALFAEDWKRQSKKISYKWNLLNYEKLQLERIQYTEKLQNYRKNHGSDAEFPDCYKYSKFFVTILILFFMIGIVAIDTAALVIFRVYIKVKVFPNDSTLQVIVGDVGSTVLNAIFIIILTQIYHRIAVALTDWENPRTHTQYEDSLILKLFVFEFVNSYGSLFYIAFFRSLEYEKGYFNLGSEYQDKCTNCMALLTIQVFVILLIKPFPRLLKTIILPYIISRIKRLRLKNHVDNIINSINRVDIEKDQIPTSKKNIQQLSHYVFISSEKRKNNFDTNIRDEYMEKIILYGYILLFACSFTLGPLILFLIILIDMRVDAKSMLWIYKRPTPYKAQDIGMFEYIITFINIVGILSNACIIAFTSNWASSNLTTLTNKLIFIVAFENGLFLILILVFFIPDSTNQMDAKIRKELKYSKEMLIASKERLLKKQYGAGINRNSTIAIPKSHLLTNKPERIRITSTNSKDSNNNI